MQVRCLFLLFASLFFVCSSLLLFCSCLFLSRASSAALLGALAQTASGRSALRVGSLATGAPRGASAAVPSAAGAAPGAAATLASLLDNEEDGEAGDGLLCCVDKTNGRLKRVVPGLCAARAPRAPLPLDTLAAHFVAVISRCSAPSMAHRIPGDALLDLPTRVPPVAWPALAALVGAEGCEALTPRDLAGLLATCGATPGGVAFARELVATPHGRRALLRTPRVERTAGAAADRGAAAPMDALCDSVMRALATLEAHTARGKIGAVATLETCAPSSGGAGAGDDARRSGAIAELITPLLSDGAAFVALDVRGVVAVLARYTSPRARALLLAAATTPVGWLSVLRESRARAAECVARFARQFERAAHGGALSAAWCLGAQAMGLTLSGLRAVARSSLLRASLRVLRRAIGAGLAWRLLHCAPRSGTLAAASLVAVRVDLGGIGGADAHYGLAQVRLHFFCLHNPFFCLLNLCFVCDAPLRTPSHCGRCTARSTWSARYALSPTRIAFRGSCAPPTLPPSTRRSPRRALKVSFLLYRSILRELCSQFDSFP